MKTIEQQIEDEHQRLEAQIKRSRERYRKIRMVQARLYLASITQAEIATRLYLEEALDSSCRSDDDGFDKLAAWVAAAPDQLMTMDATAAERRMAAKIRETFAKTTQLVQTVRSKRAAQPDFNTAFNHGVDRYMRILQGDSQ